jgi:hypothetical protein
MFIVVSWVRVATQAGFKEKTQPSALTHFCSLKRPIVRFIWIAIVTGSRRLPRTISSPHKLFGHSTHAIAELLELAATRRVVMTWSRQSPFFERWRRYAPNLQLRVYVRFDPRCIAWSFNSSMWQRVTSWTRWRFLVVLEPRFSSTRPARPFIHRRRCIGSTELVRVWSWDKASTVIIHKIGDYMRNVYRTISLLLRCLPIL